jgi:hypothetical protein
MYDAIITWSKSNAGKIHTAHYVLGEPTKKMARAMAIELHDLDEARIYNRKVVIIRAPQQRIFA